MTPVETLMDEHRNIERLLDCLDAMAVHFLSAHYIETSAARDALDFLRGYADRGHHGKEEERFFPVLESNGMSPDWGPISVMRYEHERSRQLVGQMAEAVEASERGNAEAPTRFAVAARAYVKLLREHIQKENQRLFPMAVRILGASDERKLEEEFARFERQEMRDTRAGYMRCLLGLEERFPVLARRKCAME